jgi:hypothetical protein
MPHIWGTPAGEFELGWLQESHFSDFHVQVFELTGRLTIRQKCGHAARQRFGSNLRAPTFIKAPAKFASSRESLSEEFAVLALFVEKHTTLGVFSVAT